MNRRAILFMSDMFWFLIFILCAFMIIVFLFYPLNKEIEKNKRGVSFETSTLQTDAQFYALTLSQQTTSVPIFVLGNIVNRERGTITDYLPNIVAERKTSAWKNDDSVYKAYVKHLDESFTRKEYWEVAQTERNKITQEWVPTAISILITQGKTVIDAQCFASPLVIQPQDQSDVEIERAESTQTIMIQSCNRFVSDRDEYGSVEEYQKKFLIKQNDVERVETGWVHLPIEGAFISFEVYIRYEPASKVTS